MQHQPLCKTIREELRGLLDAFLITKHPLESHGGIYYDCFSDYAHALSVR